MQVYFFGSVRHKVQIPLSADALQVEKWTTNSNEYICLETATTFL